MSPLLKLSAPFAALLLGLGCQTTEYPAPVPNSTYRITRDTYDPQSTMEIDINTTARECAINKIAETDLCVPKVDRASGEVHLSFVVKEVTSHTIVPQALTADQIEVKHAGSTQSEMELIPHNPRASSQLFVVIIDGSGSMSETDGGRLRRIDKVRNALRSQTVTEAFFPPGSVNTGVVLLTFTDQLVTLDGGPVKVLRNPKSYLRHVEEYLQPRGGYTHLYAAVRKGMTEMLKKDEAGEFLGARAAQATIIVLTDGFNNVSSADTCGDNARRLNTTLAAVTKARAKSANVKPTLYMVGLGKPYWSGTKPKGRTVDPTPANLCGKYAGDRIDGVLEREGIDHISLAWLAERGGGRSYVKQKARGLAKVFAEAAAKQYEWFEVRYRVPDPMWHRQAFETRLQFRSGHQGVSQVTFLPNPWLDAPSATHPDGRWMQLTPLRHTFTLLMPILGGLVFLSFWGAAFFNASRALFRRARPRK